MKSKDKKNAGVCSSWVDMCIGKIKGVHNHNVGHRHAMKPKLIRHILTGRLRWEVKNILINLKGKTKNNVQRIKSKSTMHIKVSES